MGFDIIEITPIDDVSLVDWHVLAVCVNLANSLVQQREVLNYTTDMLLKNDYLHICYMMGCETRSIVLIHVIKFTPPL